MVCNLDAEFIQTDLNLNAVMATNFVLAKSQFFVLSLHGFREEKTKKKKPEIQLTDVTVRIFCKHTHKRVRKQEPVLPTLLCSNVDVKHALHTKTHAPKLPTITTLI